MNRPVDLTNLRSITEGDRELEKALFGEFLSSFEAGLLGLEENRTGSESGIATWRTHAHTLKGIALNLGAMDLGDYCRVAQDGHAAATTMKDEMLGKIRTEFEHVKEFLIQEERAL